MKSIWINTLLSVGLVSGISFVGALALAFSGSKGKSRLLYLVSFSAGALLGDVFLHILPEMSEQGLGVKEGAWLLGGILVFFVLERFFHWQHSHEGEHEESVHSMVYLTQIGDSLHNFLDGLVIAASFLVSPALGFATTIAVIFHEIPQEIGNFAILIHGGWSKAKALWYNFLSALAAVLGAVLVLVFSRGDIASAPAPLLALGASSFIYIALSDIVPMLQKEITGKKSVLYIVWFVLGIGVMGCLLLLE